MQRVSRLLYTHLKKELFRCAEAAPSWGQEMEGRFRLAEGYWLSLQTRLCAYRFASPEEEITFFKVTKPRFTCEIIYSTLGYAAFLFQPQHRGAAIPFWERERDRRQRFIHDNHAFYDYYREGKTDFDHLYFLRKNFENQHLKDPALYNASPCALTNKDPLVATLLALEKYTVFAEDKLQQWEQAGEEGDQ